MYSMADSRGAGRPIIEKRYIYVANKAHILLTSHFKWVLAFLRLKHLSLRKRNINSDIIFIFTSSHRCSHWKDPCNISFVQMLSFLIVLLLQFTSRLRCGLSFIFYNSCFHRWNTIKKKRFDVFTLLFFCCRCVGCLNPHSYFVCYYRRNLFEKCATESGRSDSCRRDTSPGMQLRLRKRAFILN